MRQLIARIDDALHARLKRRARQEGRSLNAVVTEILATAVDGEDAKARVRRRLDALGMRVVIERPRRVRSRDAVIASTKGVGRAVSRALAEERRRR